MDEIGRRPALYEIRVRGKLSEHWSDWCGGLSFTSEEMGDGSLFTTLTGMVADQAALRGILAKLWDLGMTLISVNRLDTDRPSGHERLKRSAGNDKDFQ